MHCNAPSPRSAGYIVTLCVAAALLPLTGAALAEQGSAQQPASTTDTQKASTAIPVGLSDPLGPPTDPFNDTKTLGYVWGGLRFVPDVNAAYFYETNPLRTSPKGPGDTALATYSTITISEDGTGPRKLFAGVAQTQWKAVNISKDPRRVLSYEDRFSLAGWQFPVQLNYNHDVVSRSSFLVRKVNSEVSVTAKAGSVDAIRTFGTTKLALTARTTDVAIGSVQSVDGSAFRSSNSNSNWLYRVKVTQSLSETTEVYAHAQAQNFDYAATGLTDPINPTSRVRGSLIGVQRQFTEAVALAAEIGSDDKKSGLPKLVPEARHPVGSLKASYDPSTLTSAYAAYLVGTAELNDTGLSNLLTRTLSTGLNHKFNPTLATSLSYDRTHITTNELQGSVVDSKLFGTLLWKPHPKVLAALAFSRTQRQVSRLQDFVQPFVNDRFLVNITYYL